GAVGRVGWRSVPSGRPAQHPAQYRALKPRRQAVHIHDIVRVAAEAKCLSASPDLAEPGPGVGAEAALVEAERGQHDVVEAEAVEAVVQHQAGRLGAVTFASARLLADQDAELRGAVEVVDVVPASIAR